MRVRDGFLPGIDGDASRVIGAGSFGRAPEVGTERHQVGFDVQHDGSVRDVEIVADPFGRHRPSSSAARDSIASRSS